MLKGKKLFRTVSALLLCVSVLAGTVMRIQAESGPEVIDPGAVLAEGLEKLDEAVDSITVPDFEGRVCVTAADGMRSAIADHFSSEDDMSWVGDAELRFQGTSNEKGGVDLEVTLFLNSTELYRLLVSYDREENVLYLVCPELKDEVLAFPIGDFSADAQTITGKKITPEKLAEYTSALKELNDLVKTIPLETLLSEFQKYLSVLMEYVETQQGLATVTAGSLKTEAETTTWSIEAQEIQELIPRVLTMLSEDELLEQIMESKFADHVFRLAIGGKAAAMFPEGALWEFVQQALINAARKEYPWARHTEVTLARNQGGMPVRLSASMEQNGIEAELFQITGILDSPEHAFEVKLGPILLSKAGYKTTQSAGVLAQGSLQDEILRESVSLHGKGVTSPVLLIRNLDLSALKDGWLSGDFTVIWGNTEYTCDFYTDEDGLRTMRFDVKGKEWFTLTADLEEVEEADLDPMDLSEAFTVDSRKAFFKYIRDASAIRMFEKLSKASVPQEYVDMLTDGEAATESSRENTEELN